MNLFERSSEAKYSMIYFLERLEDRTVDLIPDSKQQRTVFHRKKGVFE